MITDRPPYKYQQDVFKHILQGENLIIQAPTGAGKTWAALKPGVSSIQDDGLMKHSPKHPPRIIYGVPMRVLARSFVDEFRERANTKGWPHELHPSIQSGEQPDDPQLESRLIFATVDQVLASFLNIPYGLPKRLDNMNAGAVIGSYLVFDEFHLYPQQEMMLTVLAMLKMLQGISRFVLMSATFSPRFLDGIAQILGATVIADSTGTPMAESRFTDINRLKTRQRIFSAQGGALTPDAILSRLNESERIICICNTVDRAQSLYKGLRESSELDCCLLHSRYFKEDRRGIEDWAIEHFKQKGDGQYSAANGKKVVLVATQVVEVGLDISSQQMFTECAPAASLIQRAGRCARNEAEKGNVYVFQPYDNEGVVNYAPYLEEGKEAICNKTWEALTSLDFNEKEMGFPEEQRLVEIAHSEADEEFLRNLEGKVNQRIDEIIRCMADRHPGWTSKLIRQQDNVPLYIHPDPNSDDILTSKPWQYESISLSKGQIARLLDSEEIGEANFTLCSSIEQQPDESDSPDARFQTQWVPIREKDDVYSKSNWQFVAHPNAISYSAEIGLELTPGSDFEGISPLLPERPWDRLMYHAERYHEHIAGLWWAYTMPITVSVKTSRGHYEERYRRALRDEFLYPLQRLCEQYGWDVETGERLMRLVLALHDVGKLNRRWQAWCRAWQKQVAAHNYLTTLALDDPVPLAHTDYDSSDPQQRNLQKSLKQSPRGPHAVEGAQACISLFREVSRTYDDWLAVALGAIMRHHTPDATGCGAFEMDDAGLYTLNLALQICDAGDETDHLVHLIQPSYKSSGWELDETDKAITPSYQNYRLSLMYLLFVRILRLADQRSGQYLSDQKYADQIRQQINNLAKKETE
jgi:CRISPR-associated endonuclease/helicase Cas3